MNITPGQEDVSFNINLGIHKEYLDHIQIDYIKEGETS
jgi:hypothetical protein